MLLETGGGGTDQHTLSAANGQPLMGPFEGRAQPVVLIEKASREGTERIGGQGLGM